jgi:hypothetical protein
MVIPAPPPVMPGTLMTTSRRPSATPSVATAK